MSMTFSFSFSFTFLILIHISHCFLSWIPHYTHYYITTLYRRLLIDVLFATLLQRRDMVEHCHDVKAITLHCHHDVVCLLGISLSNRTPFIWANLLNEHKLATSLHDFKLKIRNWPCDKRVCTLCQNFQQNLGC